MRPATVLVSSAIRLLPTNRGRQLDKHIQRAPGLAHRAELDRPIFKSGELLQCALSGLKPLAFGAVAEPHIVDKARENIPSAGAVFVPNGIAYRHVDERRLRAEIDLHDLILISVGGLRPGAVFPLLPDKVVGLRVAGS